MIIVVFLAMLSIGLSTCQLVNLCNGFCFVLFCVYFTPDLNRVSGSFVMIWGNLFGFAVRRFAGSYGVEEG